MTDIIVGPRVEDPLSDTEPVASSGYVRIRPSRVNTGGGQWVMGVWSEPVTLTGSPLTFKLDALTDIPYEMHVHLTDGQGGDYDLYEFRTVTASGVPLKWEDLVLANGPGAAPAIPSDLAARVAVLEAAILSVSGGASTVGAITDMSAPARTFNQQASYGAMRTTLGAAPSDSPSFTTAANAPTPAPGDADTSIATTAFVANAIATIGPAGTVSPVFTGNPTAPTPAPGDADTSIATTAFVDAGFAKKTGATLTNVSLSGTVTITDGALAIADTAGLDAAITGSPMWWEPVAGSFPARPATTRHLIFVSSAVTPTLDGSLAGGGGMVPNHDIWIRALP